MKRSYQIRAAVLFAFALLVSTITWAQDKKPLASPRDSVSATVAGSTLTINYGSPSLKGREIIGKLEKIDSVWRAGANEATTFTTTKAIKVEGKALAAGTYGFFVIPHKDGKWTVIFNTVAKQWGAYTYNKTKDALRVEVKEKKVAKTERLVYKIGAKGFSLIWDTFEVPVAVK